MSANSTLTRVMLTPLRAGCESIRSVELSANNVWFSFGTGSVAVVLYSTVTLAISASLVTSDGMEMSVVSVDVTVPTVEFTSSYGLVSVTAMSWMFVEAGSKSSITKAFVCSLRTVRLSSLQSFVSIL